MKAIIFLLITVPSLAHVIATYALATSTLCPFPVYVASSTVTLEGREILRQTFACSNDISDAHTPNASSARNLRPNPPIEGRSSDECTVPAPNCQCGMGSQCSCLAGGTVPSTSDCTTLINSTGILSEIEGATFFIPPANVEVVTFQTCSIAFANLASIATEFCWDDFASASRIGSGCFLQGSSSGVCVAADGFFLIRIGHSSSS